ncbi:hypothetical protein BC828DRAFT_380674 [Blastocladiella britannica]|nr:hypothetical protein BC828DRAFT_380674 [Blastocladiella britannica]
MVERPTPKPARRKYGNHGPTPAIYDDSLPHAIDEPIPMPELLPQQDRLANIVLQQFKPTLLSGPRQFVVEDADDLFLLCGFVVTSTEHFQVPPALIASDGTYDGPANVPIGEVYPSSIDRVLVCVRPAIEQRGDKSYYQYPTPPNPADSPLREMVVYRLPTASRTLAAALKIDATRFSAVLAKDPYWKQMKRLTRTRGQMGEQVSWRTTFLEPMHTEKRLGLHTYWNQVGNPEPMVQHLVTAPDLILDIDPALAPFVRGIVCAVPGQRIAGGIVTLKWCLCLRAGVVNAADRSGHERSSELVDQLLMRIFPSLR